MRFYTQQPQCYGGIDLQARTMDVGILNHDGAIVGHRHLPTSPEALLKTIAPSREQMVIAVECLFTWYGLADLWAQEGMPFVLGHARSMKAIHGGTAKHANIDAHKIAVLLRGGMWPQASVYPAAMRATRDLLRRRRHLMRQRAELLTHVQHTNGQDNVPAIGNKIADKTNRAGVAERVAAPAVPKSIEVDRALLDAYDQLLRDLELAMVTMAKQHDGHTLSVLQTVPGLGTSLSLVLVSERHDLARFPRVQDVVASCRVVTCAKEAAGKRDGPSGTKLGTASLTWACSEAAVLCLRHNPAGQKSLARVEKTHGTRQALTVLAHKRARAVYDM
jgi:transposase